MLDSGEKSIIFLTDITNSSGQTYTMLYVLFSALYFTQKNYLKGKRV
jgi:hypothetical protein